MYLTVIFQSIIKCDAHTQNSVSFYLYFCCFWINVTQINFENIQRKIQRIISDSCFQLKLWFNFDARAPSIPLLNFPFNVNMIEIIEFQWKSNDYSECLESRLANVAREELVPERGVVQCIPGLTVNRLPLREACGSLS